MNRQMYSLWFVAALAMLVGALAAVPLMAQTHGQPANQPTAQSSQAPDQQQPGQQAPEPGTPPARSQQPDTQAGSQRGQGQTFIGTIVKPGDRFMLQDESGKTYDIDNQEAAKKHEGKQVTVRGTLDADGKTIHVK